jgi:hypothetical protein
MRIAELLQTVLGPMFYRSGSSTWRKEKPQKLRNVETTMRKVHFIGTCDGRKKNANDGL